MSRIKITISDERKAVSALVHETYGHILLASLMAEPETLDELEAALARFVVPESDWPALRFFARGADYGSGDFPILAIDLASRTIYTDTRSPRFELKGELMIETTEDAMLPLYYELSADWRLVGSLSDYLARRRRPVFLYRARRRRDLREVLFGPSLSEFIFAAAAKTSNHSDESVAALHARWLATPSPYLDHQSPRAVFLMKQNFIDLDLHSRALQWSFTGTEPAPLPPTSAAYKFAGFGTHSFVVHFDYFRFLYATAESGEIPNASELFMAGQRWLDEPGHEYAGRRPADILEAERLRRNLTAGAHEFPFDDDCELCQMMAAEFDRPIFWHLDGSGMEQEYFEFSSYKTRDEWRRAMESDDFAAICTSLPEIEDTPEATFMFAADRDGRSETRCDP